MKKNSYINFGIKLDIHLWEKPDTPKLQSPVVTTPPRKDPVGGGEEEEERE
jgi:hypothetical protein